MYPWPAMIARDKGEPGEMVCIIHTDRLVEQVAKANSDNILGLVEVQSPWSWPLLGEGLGL